MTFRYRGFQMLATEPYVRPVVIRIFDPFEPTEEVDEFSDRQSFNSAVRMACAFVDGVVDRECQRVEGPSVHSTGDR